MQKEISNRYSLYFLQWIIKSKNTKVTYNKNEIISEIENSIIYSLRGVDVCTKFSNSQILITLVDTSEKNVDLVMNRVLKNFYDSYEDRKIQIDYETQNISIQAS